MATSLKKLKAGNASSNWFLRSGNSSSNTRKSRFRVGFVRIRTFVANLILVVLVFLLILGSLRAIFTWSNPFCATASNPRDHRFAVLINTWKRNSLLQKTVAHYATCSQIDAIHVVWSEETPPSDGLMAHLNMVVHKISQNAQKPRFLFELHKEDSLNNRFKPIANLNNDAIFSVDDDVLVPCSALSYAFTVWLSSPNTMVGFVPRMHWLWEKKDGVACYKYVGWWSVWWTGTYSMVLSKAAFLHRKYLDMYTNDMPSSILDYVARERNCEDIAMSFLVANATGIPPIWVKGKVREIGSWGISSLKGHSERRSKCINDFISFYQKVPLLTTNVKVVDARTVWLW